MWCTPILMYREQTNQSVYTFTYQHFVYFSSVMFWTEDHNLILCHEVLNLNPFTTKTGSTQQSTIWDKAATTLNNCSCLVMLTSNLLEIMLEYYKTGIKRNWELKKRQLALHLMSRQSWKTCLFNVRANNCPGRKCRGRATGNWSQEELKNSKW